MAEKDPDLRQCLQDLKTSDGTLQKAGLPEVMRRIYRDFAPTGHAGRQAARSMFPLTRRLGERMTWWFMRWDRELEHLRKTGAAVWFSDDQMATWYYDCAGLDQAEQMKLQ